MKKKRMSEKEDFLKKEIESHSSTLTNQRIADLLNTASGNIIETVSSKPDPLLSFSLFSSILSTFLNTFPIYSHPQNEEINRKLNVLMTQANNLMLSMRLSGQASNDKIEQLNQLSLASYYLMIQGLQNCRYLWRMAVQEPKGIDAALKIFDASVGKQKQNDRRTKTIHTEHGK